MDLERYSQSLTIVFPNIVNPKDLFSWILEEEKLICHILVLMLARMCY